MNLTEGASLFAGMATAFEKGIASALDHACVIVEKESKRVIGTYDYGWASLAESTKTDRLSKGFSEDEPLLRTGALRDSIKHKVVKRSGYVGSDSDVAVWQELGTRRIPPRSFLAGAAMHKGHEAAKAIGADLYMDMTGASHWSASAVPFSFKAILK